MWLYSVILSPVNQVPLERLLGRKQKYFSRSDYIKLIEINSL